MQKHSTNTRPDSGRTTSQVFAENDETAAAVRRPLWPDAPGDTLPALVCPRVDSEPRLFPRTGSPRLAHPPYAEEETEALTDWALRCDGEVGANLRSILAPCLGAGADPSMLRTLRGRHIYWWGGHLVMHDWSKRVHPVAVSATWAREIERLADAAGPHGFLVRPGVRNRASRSLISGIVSGAGPTPEGVPAFDCRRLRATWILHHLQCGTDASILLRAAGLTSFRSLDPYLDLVEWPGDDEAFFSMEDQV